MSELNFNNLNEWPTLGNSKPKNPTLKGSNINHSNYNPSYETGFGRGKGRGIGRGRNTNTDFNPSFEGGFGRGMNRHSDKDRDITHTWLKTNPTKHKQPKSLYNRDVNVPIGTNYMIDIGLNLGSSKFKDKTDEIMERAYKAGVKQVIITGSSFKDSDIAYNLSRSGKYSKICHSTVGIHPHHASEYTPEKFESFKKYLKDNNHKKVVAIGETGLDYYRMISPAEKQKESFKAHIDLALEYDLPLFLHEREAHHDFLKILDSYPKLPPIVVHCFTGKQKELKAYIDRGFYIGVTGFVCIEHRSQQYQKYINMVPLDKLMIETDSPYMKPTGSEKTPSGCNEPYLLNHIVNKLAKLYRRSFKTIQSNTTMNAIKFFRLNTK